MTTFTTTLLSARKTATGIEVPPEIVASLGAGRRPAVKVTIGGHTYESTVAPRGDRYLIPVSAENRERAGVSAGDEIDVTLELDAEPRTVAVPDDLAAALVEDAVAARAFDALTPGRRRWAVQAVESAKRPETRARRVAATVEALREGRNP